MTTQHPPCAGTNCGRTSYEQPHSPECVAEHAAACASLSDHQLTQGVDLPESLHEAMEDLGSVFAGLEPGTQRGDLAYDEKKLALIAEIRKYAASAASSAKGER